MPGRILVVDDDDAIRTLVQRLLTKSGFAVTTAVNGEDAITKTHGDAFDAVVLDLMMPRVDGFAVLRHFMDHDPEMVPKTVVATAYPRDIIGTMLEETCRILFKPFDTSQLLAAIRDCVDHHDGQP